MAGQPVDTIRGAAEIQQTHITPDTRTEERTVDNEVPWSVLRAEFLPLYERPMRAKATYRQMRQVLDEFPAEWIADLHPGRIAQWLQTGPQRSPARWRSNLRCLAHIASYAVLRGYLTGNPFKFRPVNDWIRMDARPTTARKYSKPADQVALVLKQADLEAAGGSWQAGRMQALVWTYAFTGLRKMEALQLQVADVDLELKVLTIRPKTNWRAKTEASNAEIPIAGPLADRLALWIPRLPPDCPWLFPGARFKGPWLEGPPGSKPIDRIAQLGERAGVPGLTILSFRKSIGTLAKICGIGQLELRDLLRHTNTSTQEYYNEKSPEQLRGAMDKLEDLYLRKV
jgi:integrase